METIFKLKPNRVWRTYPGGLKLDRLEKKPDPEVTHFPEDWIASVTRAINIGREEYEKEGLSFIDSGETSAYLSDLIAEMPDEILGEGHLLKHGKTIPFLIKFLDSATRLHFQCHPDREFARERLNSPYGKTEGYYILDTGPGSFIYLGFQCPPEKAILREAILKQDIPLIESCFEKISIKPGDSFIVPGGIPHAIGPDVLMIEIMEPSDLAVRFEFERAGYTLPEEARYLGKDIDFALEVFDFTGISVEEVYRHYFIKPDLVSASVEFERYSIFNSHNTDCFRLEKMCVFSQAQIEDEGFYILIVTTGSGVIEGDSYSFAYSYGDRFFITAGKNYCRILASEPTELIMALPA
jgi:mannose-6-phosphate isomerase